MQDKYVLPGTELLIGGTSEAIDNVEDNEIKAKALEKALKKNDIRAKVVAAVNGLQATRFELEIPQGTPVRQILKYCDDINGALGACDKIRMEAPIPGKRAIGIEFPNQKRGELRLREVIESSEYGACSSPLTLPIGKDIDGHVIVGNLEKLPHLLVCGADYADKSNFINAAIISMLYKASPRELKLVLIDSDNDEFKAYEGIPHLYDSTILKGAEQALQVLNWVKDEMDRRYTKFSTYGVRNINDFNRSDLIKTGEENLLPYVVIIVAELAEIMQSELRKEVEGRIMNIAQKARATGINIILATQNASVNVLTGVVKANMPSRLAYRVNNTMDSRTVMDECGAEMLVGNGDSLYSPIGYDMPKRIQSATVTSDEITAVCKFIRENN